MNIGFGSLSTAPRQMYMQRQKASQPAFSGMHERYEDNDTRVFENSAGGEDKQNYILPDDITNLKIQLATTNSVDEFIGSLENSSREK
jgi:hypothetical protein